MINSFALMLIASSFAAFVAVNWAYFKILKIAKDKNLVDNPDARKLQKTPIPVLGGIAVFIGVVAGCLAATVTVTQMPGLASTSYLLPILMAMAVMLYIGAMDDVVGLTPISRLVIEILTILGVIWGSGGCIDTFHGLFGIYDFSWWIAVPLTVFGGVGVINAINMVDGVNGLSSGLCMAMASLFGCAFIISGDMSNAMLAFVMVASLFPFYVHNVFGDKSRMFIGDAGTMVMGILMVWFMISVLRSDSHILYYSKATGVGLVAMTLAILCVPVFDTIRVMTMRMVHGRSPFSADKTHLHHVFIAAGVSHFITSVTEIIINLFIVAVWLLSVICGLSVTMQLFVVILMGIIFVWGTYAIIRYHEVHHTKFMQWLSRFSVRTHLGRKEWWKAISRWLDAPEGKDADEEDYVLVTHLERKFEHTKNHKDEDKKQIFDYIKGKAEVHVKDIIDNSGAEKFRIYPILFELEHEGDIIVIKRAQFGAPEIVAIKKN